MKLAERQHRQAYSLPYGRSAVSLTYFGHTQQSVFACAKIKLMGNRKSTKTAKDGCGAARRWFKGNMHCHSYWSDGRAFPDQAIRDYRSW